MIPRHDANAFPGRKPPADSRTLKAIHSRTPKLGSPGTVTHVPGGVILTPRNIRQRVGTPPTPCPFGQIVTIPAVGATPAGKGIKGGIVFAGDKTWNMEPLELNLAAPGEWLVWLEAGVTANNEDGVPLPGLETSDEPTCEQGAVADGYPDITAPVVVTFVGTMIIPLGTLTIADSRATFEKVGCGNITIGFCGSLNHARA